MAGRNKGAIWFALCILLISVAVISCQGSPALSPASTAAAPSAQPAVVFEIKNLSASPIVAGINQNITVTVDVTNPGNVPATNTLTLLAGGSKADSRSVELGTKATQKVSFAFSRETAGECRIQVGALSGTVFFTGPGETLTDIIAKFNPDLSKELLKLPEMREIDDADNAALGKILMLASDDKNKTFMEILLNDGIREKRQYCGPLQALLWLAYDYDFEKLKANFSRYNLHSLLTESWKNSTTSNNYKSDKWQKLDDVVARLNSPRLVSMYMRDNIKYDTAQADTMTGKRVSNIFNLNDVFTNKKGVCHEMVIFALHCLMKSGYKFDDISNGDYGATYAGIRTAGGALGHAVCLVREKGQYYQVNNGELAGPHPNMETAINVAALSVGMADWSGFWMYDLDIKTDNRNDETARFVTADAIKGRGLIQESVIDKWPSTAVTVEGSAGSYTAKTKDGKISDIKTVKAFRDSQYLYISVQMAGEIDTSYAVNYFLDLDFNGDKKNEYEFGYFPSGYSWVFDRTIDSASKTGLTAWWVFIASSKDTVEIRIPVEEYHIPHNVNVICATSERGKILDDSGWFTVP